MFFRHAFHYICDSTMNCAVIPAVPSLIICAGEKNMGELVSSIFQHMPDVTLSLVIEKAVRSTVNITRIRRAAGFHDIRRFFSSLRITRFWGILFI